MKEKESELKNILKLFSEVGINLEQEQDELNSLAARVKSELPNYNERMKSTQDIRNQYHGGTSKRIKENDYIRIYGEGTGAFVTIYPCKNKYKWVRNLKNKFAIWKAERAGKNYIFHKLRDKKSTQDFACIQKPRPNKEFETPSQITSLENMFKDLAKEREVLKNANKAFKIDMDKLKKKSFKKRATLYIPKIVFRSKK